MPRAYYNENDPYAAQYLRNLVAAGHIAPGDVDDRSIADVRADDLKGYVQCHFFAGIGGWSLALRMAGWWATPRARARARARARDHKNNGVSIARAAKGVADSLDLQCKLVCLHGMAQPSPLSARMDRDGFPLNPIHSLWLMGYPQEWASCAPTVMPSSRKSRPNL